MTPIRAGLRDRLPIHSKVCSPIAGRAGLPCLPDAEIERRGGRRKLIRGSWRAPAADWSSGLGRLGTLMADFSVRTPTRDPGG